MKYLVILSLLLFTCTSINQEKEVKEKRIENTAALRDSSLAPFYHAVASGDPLQNAVIIWTRVTPEFKEDRISVKWEVARDQSFKEVVTAGETFALLENDYCIKVDVVNLSPSTEYYYRFTAMDVTSRVGKTKTLPASDEVIRLAFASCSNIEFGYFNAYAAMVKDELDAVVHLGDYIYEYGPDVYGDTSFFRKNIPAKEIISLQDYRDRYSQYRMDEDLQNVHSSLAFINIWDDHEITNNAYMTGAENHQDEEGDYLERRAAARKAFYEWLPIREHPLHYRKFDFGQNLELIMLDERLAGRTLQPDSVDDPRRIEKEHALLGKKQMDWLKSSIKKAENKWIIIGNQVIFSYCDWAYDSFHQNMDAWDGYPADQKELANFITEEQIENIVFITGDTHRSWAFEASVNPFESYNSETSEGALGFEFGVTSISSGNADERSGLEAALKHEEKLMDPTVNPHLKYVNTRDHGYLKLEINGDEMQVEFKTVDDLSSRSSTVEVDQFYTLSKGQKKLNSSQ